MKKRWSDPLISLGLRLMSVLAGYVTARYDSIVPLLGPLVWAVDQVYFYFSSHAFDGMLSHPGTDPGCMECVMARWYRRQTGDQQGRIRFCAHAFAIVYASARPAIYATIGILMVFIPEAFPYLFLFAWVFTALKFRSRYVNAVEDEERQAQRADLVRRCIDAGIESELKTRFLSGGPLADTEVEELIAKGIISGEAVDDYERFKAHRDEIKAAFLAEEKEKD